MFTNLRKLPSIPGLLTGQVFFSLVNKRTEPYFEITIKFTLLYFIM